MYKTFETGCDKSLPKVFFNKSTKEIEITGNLYHFKPELLFAVARTGIEPVLFFDLALISTFLRFF
jgi:hypothetical protein